MGCGSDTRLQQLRAALGRTTCGGMAEDQRSVILRKMRRGMAFASGKVLVNSLIVIGVYNLLSTQSMPQEKQDESRLIPVCSQDTVLGIF